MAQRSYKRRWNIRVNTPVKEFCEGKLVKYLRKVYNSECIEARDLTTLSCLLLDTGLTFQIATNEERKK
jgi:hypothetical protein